MIQKVALYFLLPMLFIAFFLAMFGVKQIAFGDTYYSFMNSVTNRFATWRLTIPDIPKIPNVDFGTGDRDVGFLKAIANILNVFVTIINGIITVINIVISIVNIVVQMLQFILTLIYSVRDFIKQQPISVVASL